MKRQAFVGGTVVLPDRVLDHAQVICRDGLIEHVGGVDDEALHSLEKSDVIDATGRYIAPGFVDIHVHGGAGADFMDGTVEAAQLACAAHLRHGTTCIFPTTTTGSMEQILAMIQSCQDMRGLDRMPLVPGVHLYGPYFAADKVGCHSAEGRRNPTEAEFAEYFRTGFIRIATCAAELEGASAFYQLAREHQCLITCGHSNSSWSEMQAAFESGMRHVDHFWCAMSSVPSLRQRFNVPMQASMAEFVLMNAAMSTEVIADGWHLAPELLEFAYRMLGPGRLCLVTDCNRALDMPAGAYRFGNSQHGSWLRSDGHVGWAPDGGSLASSIQGMDYMVRHMLEATTASLPEVIRMASLTPAERAGVSKQTGSIEVGKRADLLLLDASLSIESVFLKGERVVLA